MSRLFYKHLNLLTNLNVKCLYQNNSIRVNIYSLQRFTNCYKYRNYSSEKNKQSSDEVFSSGNQKYDIFRDDDSPIILDVDEERNLMKDHPEIFSTAKKKDEFEGIDLTRGETGVIDVEELVAILRKINAVNIVVISVPEEYHYVDYMVITSPLSSKHMLAIAEFVRKLYKKKCGPKEEIPCIEGIGSNEWMALDLGNIALHILSKQARMKFDLETLWAVGPQYDNRLNEKEDPLIELLEKHTSLANLEPADEPVIELEEEKKCSN